MEYINLDKTTLLDTNLDFQNCYNGIWKEIPTIQLRQILSYNDLYLKYWGNSETFKNRSDTDVVALSRTNISGKVAECVVYDFLKNNGYTCSFPEFVIFDQNESWEDSKSQANAPDLVAENNGKIYNVHVKSTSKSSKIYKQPVWRFPHYSELVNNPEPTNDIVICCYTRVFDEQIQTAIAAWSPIHNLTFEKNETYNKYILKFNTLVARNTK